MTQDIPTPRRAGASSLRAVALAGIILVVVGLAIWYWGRGYGGETSELLRLVRRLETACAEHHADLGYYGHEYSGIDKRHRLLSTPQGSPHWKGPYLESPLTRRQNPFSGTLQLYDTVRANDWIEGFDLDGDREVDVTGPANMLWISGVPEAVARAVDYEIDGGLGDSWTDAGRVRYRPEDEYLLILVHR